jgi:5-methylthioribose kinase
MRELTPENANDYLRERGWIDSPARVEPLGGGVSNVVFRIVTAERTFVLKQSRPQLRTKADWFSDVERVYREQEVMVMLHPLLPDAVVPEVLFVDHTNCVFAMSHAPAGSRAWKEMLLAGEVDLALGERVGTILGQIHQKTAAHPHLVKPFRDHKVFVQLRVDPFYRRIQEKYPELATPIEHLIDAMLVRKRALCHGDFSPKNILVHEQGFTLVDFETACHGDPTMDLGFFLSHIMLKAVKRQRQREEFFELTRAFWRGYAREVTFTPADTLETQALRHFAVCALARVDGTSPVDYLPEEPKRELVRRLSRGILLEWPRSASAGTITVFGQEVPVMKPRSPTWDDVVLVYNEECKSLGE